jgi:hypothetical protein
VHGWMEFLAKEHAKELAQEARRQRLFQILRGIRRDKSSSRSRRLLRWLPQGATDTARKPAAGDSPAE